MIPYIICAGLSCLSAHLGTKTYVVRGRRIKSISVLFFAIAIFLPCFLAAVRDHSVGTDVQLYGYNMFVSAQSKDISTFVLSHRSEPLFNIIAYVIAQLHNEYIYFFTIESLVVYPVFLTIRRYVDSKYIWLAFFLFYCVFFGFSLNLMRQCIAMAVLFWGCRFIFERKPKQYFIIVGICFFIHYSSIIAAILYPLSVLDEYSIGVNGFQKRGYLQKYSSIIKMVLSGVAILLVGVSGEIIGRISEATEGRYSTFVNGITGSFDFDLIYLILIGGVVLLYWHQIGNNKKMDITGYLFYVVFLGIIVYQARGVFSQLLRVSLYFTNFLIILLPRALSLIEKRKKRTSLLLCMITVIILSLFVYYYYTVKNWNGIYPYRSSFLGIE